MPRPPILPVIEWPKIFNSGKSYEDWLEAAEDPEQRKKIIEGKLEVTLSPQQEGYLKALPKVVHIVVFAEDWCGDVVRHVPVLEKMAEVGEKIHTRYLTRDEAPEVFARYLTNGGEAVPKFVFLSDQFMECSNWGPMPENCRELISRGKACNNVPLARKKVAALYALDSEKTVVLDELFQLLQIATCALP